MLLSDLPPELVQEIVAFALDDHPLPSNILRVTRSFFQFGQSLLHTHLHFRSADQLSLFARGRTPLSCAPRSLTISFAGGSANFLVFQYLADALRRCGRSSRSSYPSSEHSLKGSLEHACHNRLKNNLHVDEGQVSLDVLSLCLHSHTSNPYLSYIHEALSLARSVLTLHERKLMHLSQERNYSQPEKIRLDRT